MSHLQKNTTPAHRETASEEAGRRLDQVLKSAENLTPEGLRHVRVCEVLEGIGTPEATRILRGWAAGAEGARLTVEAKESLGRLEFLVQPRSGDRR